MKKLSEIYKDLGIAFAFPIVIKNENGDGTYFEEVCGYWCRRGYDEQGNLTYYESSLGYWEHIEYDKNGNETYFESGDGLKRGTQKGSCAGKVIEVDGKKYKLTEL